MVYMGREGQCIWQQTCNCVRVAEDIGCEIRVFTDSDSCRDNVLYLRSRCAVQSTTFTKNNSPSIGLRLKEEVKSFLFPVFHVHIFPAFHSSLSLGNGVNWGDYNVDGSNHKEAVGPEQSTTAFACFILQTTIITGMNIEHACVLLWKDVAHSAIYVCIYLCVSTYVRFTYLRVYNVAQYKGFFSIQSFFHIFCLSKCLYIT